MCDALGAPHILACCHLELTNMDQTSVNLTFEHKFWWDTNSRLEKSKLIQKSQNVGTICTSVTVYL